MGYLDEALSYSNPSQSVETPSSGGGLSQNGKFSYGYASSAGKRSSMEDFFETRIEGVDGEIVGLFGVFDGHGGARAAEYVKRHLFSNLITHPKFISDTKSAITDAYNHTDSELLKSEDSHNRDAGSTASTAILLGDRLLVANVGDSRAVISRAGTGIILRPGFIYGTRSVGNMKIPLGVFGSPMEMVLQQAKPLNQLPLVGPLFTPPVNVESVAKVAVRAATDPVFPPGIVDVHGIQRYSQQKSR
ncbi:unnamed protein product [Brassica rapa]|uniref:protein-serine/threonine phosphatase n=1 Tax=Brassica campestris TaxID=3711 RepID=A0A8D9MJ93_BRACM|nr:unnamed protein product [Brassica rapa]